MLTVGRLIKMGRVSKRLSQDDLADRLDVTKNYVSLVENDKKDPSIGFLKKAAKILDIPLMLLVWEKIDMPKGKTEDEKNISKQLEKLLEDAQRLFTRKAFESKA